ncbi:hypothetical protein METUNv1_01420 [Methyloversatilis universalis FAM5]|uniref:Uncharacterized protein n=1 Tax=Methyloversatilis universalis (strain ATCC BAA-1314 / DSM 25237 / JCM 13912 / CCUG 52030 / FAM5) TaxID=1000565 RepID=F5RAT3_METUF|nr:hypothetical protein METUNv1_01420 [Methyloversatilis universalis FAM5]
MTVDGVRQRAAVFGGDDVHTEVSGSGEGLRWLCAPLPCSGDVADQQETSHERIPGLNDDSAAIFPTAAARWPVKCPVPVHSGCSWL